MSRQRRRWVAGMPTHEELVSELYHPAEESPQGPIPTGPEFRCMRIVLGLSLPELADRMRRPVHRLATIESRSVPEADVDELLLHTVLMKSGVRWNADLAGLLARALADSDVQSWSDLMDRSGSVDAADLVSSTPQVRVDDRTDHLVVCGRGVEAVMAYPFDLEDFWDVVEDVAGILRPGGPA